MAQAAGKKETAYLAIGIIILAIIIFWKFPQESQSDPNLEDLSMEGFKASGIRVFTNPPENVTNMTSKTWQKEGTTTLGEKTYRTYGSEITLNIYEYDPKFPPSKESLLKTQKGIFVLNGTYQINGKSIEHYIIQTSQPPRYVDIYPSEKRIYLLSYHESSTKEAGHILGTLL